MKAIKEILEAPMSHLTAEDTRRGIEHIYKNNLNMPHKVTELNRARASRGMHPIHKKKDTRRCNVYSF